MNVQVNRHSMVLSSHALEKPRVKTGFWKTCFPKKTQFTQWVLLGFVILGIKPGF